MFLLRALFWLAVFAVFIPASTFEAIQVRVHAYVPIVINMVGEQVATSLIDLEKTCIERPDLCGAAQGLFSSTSELDGEAPGAHVVPAGHDERI